MLALVSGGFVTSRMAKRREKRWAESRMADYGKPGEPEALIPPITQETLAEMVGTTRSRVSFFMNRFRKLGYIEYKGRIRVHKSLLNMVLKDLLPEENSSRPKLLHVPRLAHQALSRR